MEAHEIVTINGKNLDSEHICCAIGDDITNKRRSDIKKKWMLDRLDEGLVFKKFNIRGKAFIEYIPAEYAWKPVDAPGYMMIHCLWVSGRFKGTGMGKKLFEECMNDARDTNGIVVISGNKKMPFLTDKKFFLKNGFEVCDTFPPYFELLVKRNRAAPLPKFNAPDEGVIASEGFTFMYTHQCPFTEDWVDIFMKKSSETGIPAKKLHIDSLEKAKSSPSPFTTFGLFYNGRFITHVIPGESKFNKMLKEL